MGRGGDAAPAPTLIVIGAAKAGTTTLHTMLDTLSGVYMSTPKELEYFSHPEHPDHPLTLYFEHFRPGEHHRHRGESSPTYTMFPTIPRVPERIHAMNPDVRLIYLVREPVARMVSAYAQTRRMGYEFRPIDEALTSELAYLTPSLYWMQLRQYLHYFERDQIHVEDLEDLRTSPMEVLARIADFLEVPCDGHPVEVANPTNGLAVRVGYGPVLRALRRRNLAKRRWQRAIQRSLVGSKVLTAEQLRPDPGIAHDLKQLFSEDIAALEEWLSRPFPHWH